MTWLSFMTSKTKCRELYLLNSHRDRFRNVLVHFRFYLFKLTDVARHAIDYTNEFLFLSAAHLNVSYERTYVIAHRLLVSLVWIDIASESLKVLLHVNLKPKLTFVDDYSLCSFHFERRVGWSVRIIQRFNTFFFIF